MPGPVEYLFCRHIDTATTFADAHGWRSLGRVQWQKRDGTIVFLLSLKVQLEIVSPGEMVHVVVGRARDILPVLKRLRAVVMCHD
jgi:hypothetical protein